MTEGHPQGTLIKERKPWYHLSLAKQIFLGLVIGVLLGALFPKWSQNLGFLRDIFLHLIKSMIAPLIFGSVVQGIANEGDIKKVGRMGLKALIYFEVVTIFALIVGLAMANIVQPGAGVHLSSAVDTSSLGVPVDSKPPTATQIILHAFPESVIAAMANGDVLQIVIFSMIFAAGLILAGDAGKPVLTWCQSLTQIMFKFAGIVMKFAPIGVGAAIAVTVGHQGLGVLLDLLKLVLTLYGALVVFVVVVLGSVIWIAKVPLRPFIRAIAEPFTLAFATANSESALPDAFARMERFGVPRGIVGFVLPTGYSFNLDGSTLHLAMASVFIAQAAETTTGVHFGIGQQIAMMLMLMLTSKGVAAVPRASVIVLIGAVQSFHLPLEGVVMILGVDAFMDMARTSVNVLGNCLASVVVARWEGEFDESKAWKEFGKPKAAA
jgi:proton glutamate symport protein